MGCRFTGQDSIFLFFIYIFLYPTQPGLTDRFMNKSQPKFIDCFAELIAQPSISSFDPRLDQSNRAVIGLLADWLSSMGFAVEQVKVNDDPEKFNLIACAGRGPGGLVLAGHTDTVPFNETAWSQDPFRLTERENRLYGLGTSDMKCFFPIIIECLKQFNLSALQQPLYVLATCDEESTMAGIVETTLQYRITKILFRLQWNKLFSLLLKREMTYHHVASI